MLREWSDLQLGTAWVRGTNTSAVLVPSPLQLQPAVQILGCYGRSSADALIRSAGRPSSVVFLSSHSIVYGLVLYGFFILSYAKLVHGMVVIVLQMSNFSEVFLPCCACREKANIRGYQCLQRNCYLITHQEKKAANLTLMPSCDYKLARVRCHRSVGAGSSCTIA